jgi:di/tricarboxylate transporter
VIMAALAGVFTRCLTMTDSYRAIHWSSLVLIAGMLPLADALNATGGTQWVVDRLLLITYLVTLLLAPLVFPYDQTL